MAGDAHVYKLVIKGLDYFKVCEGRFLANARLESVDSDRRHLHVIATACEVDLHKWFAEGDASPGEFPDGTLINFMRVYV